MEPDRGNQAHQATAATFSFEWNPVTDRIVRSEESARILAGEPRATGQSGDELLARIHPDDLPAFEATLGALSPQRPTYRIRYRYVTPDGSEVVLDEHGRGLFDTGGRLIYLIGVTADVTATQRAAEDLRTSERRLRLALAAARAGTWCLDPMTGTLLLSEEARALFGLARSGSCTLSDVLARIHPDDRSAARTALHQAVHDGAALRVEVRISGPAPAMRWLALHAELCNENPDDRRLLGLVQDVTEHKELSQDLRHQRELLQRIIDSIPVFIVIAEPSAPGWRVNRELERLIGRSAAELAADTTLVKCLDTGAEDRSRPVEGGEGGWRDLRIRARDGTEIDTSWACVRVSDGTRVGIGIDIRERKRIEDALRAADRRKDEFLAILGHELRTPLAPIRNAVELMRLDEATTPGLRETLEVIARHAQHITRLLDDLTDISRISQGKLELRCERLDLRDVLSRALELVQPRLDSRGHALELALAPDPVPVVGDSVRLCQVFFNLLENAAEYTDRGGTVRIQGGAQAHEAVIGITDTGRGIPPGDLGRIFDPFSRGHAAAGAGSGPAGLGLGLSIVRRLAEMHGGRVTAESAGPGRGSTFTLRLPLAPADGARAQPRDDATPVGRSPIMRILVVEDDRDIAESTVLLLEALGHDVAVATDGEGALRQVREGERRVILLDIGLRDMDGTEVARRLRALPEGQDLFIAAVTGYADRDTRARVRAAGIDHHLIKPVGLEELRRLLEAVP